MKRKTKISILIIIIYFISFFLFEFLIGSARVLENAKRSEELGMLSIFTPLETLIEAGIWHFICALIVAIVCRFIKQIDKSYKHIIYALPMITFIFSIPIGLMTTYFAKFFRMVWALEYIKKFIKIENKFR